jgi:uncharacterized protein with ATP-grasp and redox domains
MCHHPVLPPGEQEYTRHHVAKNIKKLLNKQSPYKEQTSRKGKKELKLLNRSKTSYTKTKP